MATPNIANIATITPKNAMGSLSDTNRTTMIDVPAETAVRIDTMTTVQLIIKLQARFLFLQIQH